MQRAQHGTTVTISYIGTLDNGRIFHSTEEEGPISFTIGNDQVFAKLEQAVLGMAVGEAKNIVIPAAEAYGPRLETNIVTVKRETFPADRELRIGEKITIAFGPDRELVVMVLAADSQQVTLDGNHPLAGLDLTFALRLDALE